VQNWCAGFDFFFRLDKIGAKLVRRILIFFVSTKLVQKLVQNWCAGFDFFLRLDKIGTKLVRRILIFCVSTKLVRRILIFCVSTGWRRTFSTPNPSNSSAAKATARTGPGTWAQVAFL
jgi:hypothetical protein